MRRRRSGLQRRDGREERKLELSQHFLHIFFLRSVRKRISDFEEALGCLSLSHLDPRGCEEEET